jgi:PAS domain S-box-containing protein
MATLLSQAREAILIRSVGSSEIRYWNRGAVALYGWTAAQARGRSAHALLKTVYPQPVDEIEALLMDNGYWEGELRHTCRDGRRVTVISRWIRQGDRGGQRWHLEINTDITEHKHLEQQNQRLLQDLRLNSRALELASKHKSQFLASMSHELRTPLNAIIGFSEVLLDHSSLEIPEEQRRAYVEHIHLAGQHLLRLINDSLDMSKIEAGQMDMHWEEVKLGELIANCVALIQGDAGPKGIRVEAICEPPDGAIIADVARVEQVLYNLLSNAVKFTPNGGHIGVRARVGIDGADISVTDNGIGIAPEDRATIFEPFRQAKTGPRPQEGTGLGLALASQFVQAHGGRIEVESTPGEGSCFNVWLPRTPPDSVTSGKLVQPA